MATTKQAAMQPDIPLGIRQLAAEAQRIVDSNNAMKISNFEEQQRQELDYTSKGLAYPNGPVVKPVLTKFDADAYMTLYMADADKVAQDGPKGKATDSDYDNLSQAYSFYTYEPPAGPVPEQIPQPKNPLGILMDAENGVFAPAPGDRLPTGSQFTLLGTLYIKRDMGTQKISGDEKPVRLIFWFRQ